MRIVAIEEHYVPPEHLVGTDTSWMPHGLSERLTGTTDRRLADMDAAGIDVQVVSFSSPVANELSAEQTRAVNDVMHQRFVAARPDRFSAFAALPVSLPEAAAAELERAVDQLGFVGAMICGTVAGRFLDHPDFDPVLDAAARLGVPLYLHPGMPPRAVSDVYYGGLNPSIGQVLQTGGYGWHYETSLHALRLIVTGAFDRHPDLKIIIGHLGEGLPFHWERIEEMMSLYAPRADLAKPIDDYLRENFWITTSGYFFDGPLRLARATFGDERIIFSVDYPFSENKHATDWLRQLALPAGTRERIAHGTADALLGLR
ncbi:amidohydrolase family protein [Amycolatopsis sp. YIM 10]|uniref:amidohydrolase family protein n=1 Tax=Amycolatopsis sp. YIM 10 TaxID=2653857 RepID=UPI00128FD0E8|nr:amidohydrolase family protein [Amycolatopsis sp. YIM 10]QFU91680.1 Amidohydrolase [Amycolatopsis sp. YIM 10]